MAKQLTLFDAATARGRIIRQGEIVQLVMDGSGAVVCPAQEFMVNQKWAQTRAGSTNLVTDRGRFLDRFEILIARPGSFVNSRGNTRALQMLAKQMTQAGYDLAEWELPHDVKLALKAPTQPEKKPKPEELPVPKAELAKPAPADIFEPGSLLVRTRVPTEANPEPSQPAERPEDWL